MYVYFFFFRLLVIDVSRMWSTWGVTSMVEVFNLPSYSNYVI